MTPTTALRLWRTGTPRVGASDASDRSLIALAAVNDVGGAERPPSVRTAFVLGGGGGGTWGAVEVGMLQSLVDHGAAFAADPSAATDRYLDTIDVRQALRQDR